jgi:hypothetical protein
MKFRKTQGQRQDQFRTSERFESTKYIVTCHLGSQPIQRFVARQQFRNMQQYCRRC